ncbi:MAG TPA: chromosome partitioning protein ParB, partial [Bacteroidales bacterium]|nr:chromosome partitioning protein ParB [Bacteroidales bacterium]
REDFDQEALNELAASIKEQGIIQPITVRKMGYDKYQLISGERRLKASKLAGMDEIPCYIRIANDQQMLEMALVENIQRESLNALEIAISYQRLIEECEL